jgi:hypothetical protein
MRHLGQLLLSAVLLGVAGTPASGHVVVPLSMPEQVKKSDIIVVGTARREDDRFIVHVLEEVKGQAGGHASLTNSDSDFWRVPIPVGETNIYLLQRSGKGWHSAPHQSCIVSTTELQRVETVLNMYADPGPYLAAKQYQEDPDLVYIIGEQFSGWRVTSEEIPELNDIFATFSRKYHETWPWTNRAKARLSCKTDTNAVLQIVSARPAGPLADFLTTRMHSAARSSRVKQLLKPQFSVTLDTRVPETVGTATSNGALSYLGQQLCSDNAEIVIAALLALAKMRDTGSVRLVIPLLKREDKDVRVAAVKFLGWTRSKLAAKTLCELLDAESKRYPKEHDICNRTAVALKCIGAPESVDCLERAACLGMSRAIEAVASVGNSESFEVLLRSAKRDPQRHAYMTHAFYWLVRRSNKKLKPWMASTTWTQDIGAMKLTRWFEWWDLHGKDFKVTKSQAQAIKEGVKDGT